jgi:hypothetical protein
VPVDPLHVPPPLQERPSEPFSPHVWQKLPEGGNGVQVWNGAGQSATFWQVQGPDCGGADCEQSCVFWPQAPGWLPFGPQYTQSTGPPVTQPAQLVTCVVPHAYVWPVAPSVPVSGG